MKKTAPRPSWTNCRLQIEHLRWVDTFVDSRAWWQSVALSKITDFEGKRASDEAAVLGDYGQAKRTAVLHTAQEKGRDDTAAMFCQRVAILTKRSRLELRDLNRQQRKVSDLLIGNYQQVPEHLDPLGPAAAQQAAAPEMARKTVEAVGVFPHELARIDGVRATHSDNHVPLVARHCRKDRSSMLAMVGVLDFEASTPTIAACWSCWTTCGTRC